jgi:hypothetical protein
VGQDRLAYAEPEFKMENLMLDPKVLSKIFGLKEDVQTPLSFTHVTK